MVRLRATQSRESASTSNTRSTTKSKKSEKRAGAETAGLQHFEKYKVTDEVVVSLDVIPKLLFDGMVSDDAATVESAVESLADIFRVSNEKRAEAYQAGGHAVVIVTMKKWIANEAIQTSSCRCIQNMSCTNAEAKESFAAIGGLEVIVTAMRSFPNSQRVQRSGCGALMNLLSGNEAESVVLQTMANKFVAEYNGIALVVRAMKSFPREMKIQLWGNGLFQNLAQTKEFQSELMRAGAVAAAGGSLEFFPDDANITQYATKFMRIMFSP